VTDFYPDHETYRALYKRYFDGRDVSELLDLAEPLQGAEVVDLCGGEGQLSLAALARGAREVTLVDAEEKMIPWALRRSPSVKCVTQGAEMFLHDSRSDGVQFDRIVCRQAVNYWLHRLTAPHISPILREGGIFAFNTFNERPPDTPRILAYELDGHSFVEISYAVEDTVHHVQARDGLEPHKTSFAWLPPEKIRELLQPHFEVSEKRDGKTSLYRCVKK
jgi:2-polyprenyl-3-methyl-5-hydroxy-6-metoxy-1,4-benzoquinol methylase